MNFDPVSFALGVVGTLAARIAFPLMDRLGAVVDKRVQARLERRRRRKQAESKRKPWPITVKVRPPDDDGVISLT